MATNPVYDIRIWEQIRSEVQRKTDTLLDEIRREISSDRSLGDYHGMYPVPWQLKEVMLQRADTWVQRLYELCCNAYKRCGNELSAEFDRAIWAYWIEPFIMGERDLATAGYKISKLLDLLLCAVGSPPEKRNQLKVGQKDCCLIVRNEFLFSWQKKLLRLAARLDEQTRWVPVQPSRPTTTPTIPAPSPPPPISALAVSRTNGPVNPKAPEVCQSPAALRPARDVQSTAPADANGGLSDPAVPSPPYSGATDWQAIEIVFLSDHRVQIRIDGKQTQPANYAELGFADGRSENPNKAWLTLRSLAEHRGVINDGRSIGGPWTKVEKRIQEIRKILRARFHISADPIPFIEGTGYQAIFKIGCRRSYET